SSRSSTVSPRAVRAGWPPVVIRRWSARFQGSFAKAFQRDCVYMRDRPDARTHFSGSHLVSASAVINNPQPVRLDRGNFRVGHYVTSGFALLPTSELQLTR